MEWPLVRLDRLYDIARGGSPRPIKKFITDDPDGINWIKISDATASDKYIYETKQKIISEGIQRSRFVKEGDFILSNSMSFGRPYIMGTSGCIHDGWLVLSPRDESIDQDFLYYILGSPFVFQQFDSLAAGSTVRNLNIDLVSGVKIPLLPIPEQKRIVTILDQVFADIEQARAKTEQNLKNARELFESYLQQVFSQRGEGWVEQQLGSVCSFLNGFAFKSKDAIELSNTQLIRMGNLYQHKLDLNRKPALYPDSFVEEHKRYKLKQGDLIISLTGTVGKRDYGYTVQIPRTDKALLLNQRIAKFVDIDCTMIEKSFLLRILRSKSFLDNLYATANGTRQANLSTVTMRNMLVCMPSIEDQRKICSDLDALEKETENLAQKYNKKIVHFDELKKSILQKAFTGELTKTEIKGAAA